MFKKSVYLLSLGLLAAFALGHCKQENLHKVEQSEFTTTTLVDISSLPGLEKSANQMPQGIATDSVDLYVTDFFNHTILKINIKTGKVFHFAGTLGVTGYNDGPAAKALFNRPFGILLHDGNLYVADSGSSVIRKISIATGQVSTFAGKAFVAGHLNGPPEKALLRYPFGLATDGKYLYVSDAGNSTIRKIDLQTRHVSTVAGMAGVAGMADGKGDNARFNSPKGITTDGKNLYVADTINGAVRKVVLATGDVTTLAGRDFQPGGADGVGSDARFNNPTGATMMNGLLYIADSGNSKIRLIHPETGEVVTIAGKHIFESNCPLLNLYHWFLARTEKEVTSESADGKGLQSRFRTPAGITTDGKRLFVVDTKNHLIRILQK